MICLESPLCIPMHLSWATLTTNFFIIIIIYLFILAALSLCCDTQDLHCSMQAYSGWDSPVMACWLSCSLASGILVL